MLAAQEREKGNEAFRATDYDEALRHYNASIDIDSNLNAYNNRAMTCKKVPSLSKLIIISNKGVLIYKLFL